MCNQDHQQHLQNAPLSSLYGYISRRIESHLTTLLRPYEIGLEQMIALMILSKEGCINVSQLSEYMLKDKTTTSRLITSLESKGLLKKCQDNKVGKKDKRIVYLHLTKNGEEKIAQVKSSQIQSQMEQIFENALGTKQKKELKSMLLKIIEVLDEKN